MKNKISFKIIIIFLSLMCFVLSALCINFYMKTEQYKQDIEYVKESTDQIIRDAENGKYTEWIDNLGTDEYSAYRQGYLDGKSGKQIDDREFESDISNDDDLSIYKKGYSDGLKDGYDKGTDNTYSEAYDEGYHDASKEYEKDNKIKYLFVSIVIIIIFAAAFINPFTKKKTN